MDASLVLRTVCSNDAALGILAKDDLLSLACSSKECFSILAPHIVSIFYFNLYPQSQFNAYQPRKLIIHIAQFQSAISNLPQHLITHIIFGVLQDTILDEIPPAVTFISFEHTKLAELPPLPPTVTHLHVGIFLRPIDFPTSLTHLTMKIGFKHHINSLPPNLVYLDCQTSRQIRCDLPQSLEFLTYAPYASPVRLSLPNLTHLNFGDSFCGVVFTRIPPVTHLTFGEEFNQPLDNLLPESLRNLSLGGRFNHPINNLPSKLEHLEFIKYAKFNLPITTLPSTLRKLIFGQAFNSTLNLPPNLTHLFIPNGKFNESIRSLPASLTHLRFSNNVPHHKRFEDDAYGQLLCDLPPHLIELDISNYQWSPSFKAQFKTEIPQSVRVLMLPQQSISKIPLPPAITHLTFGDAYNQHVNDLPPSLVSLTFGINFDQPVYSLPNSLEQLTFGFYFNQPLEHLPQSLKELNLGPVFNQPVNNLPPNLKTIKFGPNFNQPVDKLPTSLRSLDVGECTLFSQPLNALPPNLFSLIIPDKCNQSLESLPSFLRKLTIYDCRVEKNLLQNLFFKDKIEASLKSLPLSLITLELPHKYRKVNLLPPTLYPLVNVDPF